MKHSELKVLIREVIEEMTDDTDNLPGDLGLAALEELGGQVTNFKNRVMDEGNSPDLEADTLFSVNGVDGLDIHIKAEFSIYKGSGRPDDPNDITLDTAIVTENFMDSDLERVDGQANDPKEEKIITAIRTAVKLLYPKTPPGVFIPVKVDMLVINEKLHNYLDSSVEALKEELYEKATKHSW
jgi:hypothetical protein